jgi:dihydroflavonol-4-reductase
MRNELMPKERVVLVTGACGFVGSHLVDQLLEIGDFGVRGTDLSTADHTFLNPACEFMQSDLRNPDSLRRVVQGVDIIYHTASLFRYSAAWNDLYAVNVEGTCNLIHAASDAEVSKLVLISSSGVYGFPHSLPVREEDPKCPSNPYERSKWEQEQTAQEICLDSGLDLIVLRPAPIYGPRNRYGIGTIIQMISKGQLPIISENLNKLVPLVHVADVVGAALYLTNHPDALGEAYNVVDDTTYRKYELFSYVAPLLDTKVYHTQIPLPQMLLRAVASWAEWKARHITHVEPKLERATIDMMYHGYWFSNAKLKATGYQFIYPDCRIGLKDTIDWYQLHGWV